MHRQYKLEVTSVASRVPNQRWVLRQPAETLTWLHA